MRKLILYLGAFLLLGAVLTGFTNNAEQDATTDKSNELQSEKPDKAEIQEGVSGVIAKVKELQKLTEERADNTDEINELGEAIEKNWDSIEKKVEASHPEDYKNIEESLYPLIATAKKDKVNKTNLRTLSLETLDKLEAFKQKL
ncbi:hypothetical protein FH966_10985 [Lentibacillus cibarius]|uniref:DUF4363 family protein n=1 Tax=Lentibacillus cibarius TaxID=2583219 RepID=A0A549YJU6_9BACI|nr:hypothetical protein [Lentibacillus cibarius]TRM12166.1 hypothetical protein FH966_10985 [Lentibacillus cibarius]